MAEGSAFVPTSIGKEMTARLRQIHKSRGIYIAAGPPGIGKSTAIDYFANEHPGQVCIVKTDRVSVRGVVARMALQDIIAALRKLIGSRDEYVYHDTQQLKHQLGHLIELWARDWIDHYVWETRRTDPDWYKGVPPLTLVFDEAQTLSREAIEALRYWNDRDRCFGPFPVGLAFVGNNEFSLQSGKNGQSVISAAVADRARYISTLDYDDVTNADLRLIIKAHSISDDLSVSALIKHYATPRAPRSLRRLIEQSIADIKAVAGDSAVDLAIVNTVLAA